MIPLVVGLSACSTARSKSFCGIAPNLITSRPDRSVIRPAIGRALGA
jgi:hypothetical protein